jgi:CRP-like cAMP-binding protein
MLTSSDITPYLTVFKELELGDLMALSSLMVTRELAAGDTFIQEGSTSQRMAYIKKGLIRAYALKANGQEATMFLTWEGHFVASPDCIFLHRPAAYTYQALEDTSLVEMDYARASPIIDDNTNLSMVRNGVLMQMLAQAITRVEGFVLLSPEERYIKLVNEKQDIINRVPDKYLATLLGITAISLSRIRRRLANTQKKR